MLQIINPIPFVSRIVLRIHSIAVYSIIFPIAFVNISIDVCKLAIANNLIVNPLTLEASAIKELQPPDPMSFTILKVARVLRPILKCNALHELQTLSNRIKLELSQIRVILVLQLPASEHL